MMKKFYLILTCAAFCACGGNGKQQASAITEEIVEETTTPQTILEKETTWYDGEIPLIFDAYKDYPITNIKLSELADTEFIPLETNDSVLLRLIGTCKGNEYLLTNEYIYLEDRQEEIYTFTRKGKFVHKINRRGGGPEEYTFIGSFVADPKNEEIFIQDLYSPGARDKRGKTLVYDMKGNYKRHFPNRAWQTVNLNDSMLLNYFEFNPGGPRYSVVRKSDGSEVKKLPIRFSKKYQEDYELLQYGRLITSPQGAFMAHLGNDTIFEIMRNDLSVRPRIIDQSNYPTINAQAHPTLETSRYLIFYILSGQNHKSKVKQHFYIYDKKERQIYQMKDYKGNDYWVLLDDYPHVTNWSKTQNPHIAVRTRQVYAVKDQGHKYSNKEIAKLADKLTEDDNPILQVMIFHDVESVKR